MSSLAQTPSVRSLAIDRLRGLVMVLMVLDHTRDFFSNAAFSPTDLDKSNAAMFWTRWVTHLCAPVFVLLAGVGAALSLSHGKSRAELSRFLWTRGLWLVVLEFTVVRFGWQSLQLEWEHAFVQVIWALGVSMVVLAGLIHLPEWALWLVSLVGIVGHNSLDAIAPAQLGDLAWLWQLVHVQSMIGVPAPGHFSLLVVYPLVPWIFVMSLGFLLGLRLSRGAFGEGATRAARLAGLGIGMLALFTALRALNVYGDPQPFVQRSSGLASFYSFINVSKYPPSLLYLLATLGVAALLWSLLEKGDAKALEVLTVFGRVPLFFYLIHLPLLHTLADLASLWREGHWQPISAFGPHAGFDLPGVYAVWLFVLVLLYPICRWFAALKARRKDWWLSYL